MALSDLEAYGLEFMTDEGIDDFLRTQRVGTLGLPTEGAPYMVPLSFGYDGEDALYFTYLVGEGSTKYELSQRAVKASFLVYGVESMFNWRSVSLMGTLEQVPERLWGDIEDVLAQAWRPELFQSASMSGKIVVFRFDIERRSGIKHTGLAEGMQGE